MVEDPDRSTGVTADTLVVAVLVVAGLSGSLVLWGKEAPPILIAVFFALGASSAFYRFLGGVDGSDFKAGAVKLGGTAAVFMAITVPVNVELTKQGQPQPHPDTWLAMDLQSGSPVDVTILGVTHPAPDSVDLTRVPLRAVLAEQGLIVRDQGARFALGTISTGGLQDIGMFNTIGSAGQLRFSPEMHKGDTLDLAPLYPFELAPTLFEDDLNYFELVSREGVVLLEAGLRSKEARVFSADGGYYLLFVVRADHQTQDPFAVFGLTSLMPTIAD